jgi:putative flippase GtrA
MQPELISESQSGLVAAARALAVRLHIPTTFAKFLIVGGIGFVINQVMLFLLYDTSIFFFLPDKGTEWDIGPYTANARLLISSIIAVETAIFFQFNAHERWTFRWRPRNEFWLVRFVKFQASSIISPIIIVATTNVLTTNFDMSPYVSNAIGVVLGVTWNWVANTLLIWRDHRHPAQPEEPADAPAPTQDLSTS